MSGGPGSKEKILYCARDLFYYAGYQATSVDDILRECGVAKSNFYYHFRTKDDLALAVLDLHVAEFERRALGALCAHDGSPTERLDRFCDALVVAQAEIQRMGGCPFGNFAAALSILEGDERADRFRNVLCGVFHHVQTALTACVQDGIDARLFRSDIPAEQLAMTLLAAIEGLMLMTKTQRSAAPLVQGLPVLKILLHLD